MSESTDPLAWLHRAEEDWLLARLALRRKVPLIYGATFHVQQCAEKYLKALLVSRRQAFPRTHDGVQARRYGHLAADGCEKLLNSRNVGIGGLEPGAHGIHRQMR